MLNVFTFSFPVDVATDNKPSGAEVLTEAKDEELCSNLTVFENIDVRKLNQEFFEMLVENILKGSDSQHYTLEIIPHISSAVVGFQTGKGKAL